jgi:hypothetical protein
VPVQLVDQVSGGQQQRALGACHLDVDAGGCAGDAVDRGVAL